MTGDPYGHLLGLLGLALIVLGVVGVVTFARQNMGEPSAERWLAVLFICALLTIAVVMALAQMAQAVTR